MRSNLFRRRLLTSSARRFATAGWPVAAGAWWDGTRYRCSATPCRIAGHHPVGHGPPAGTCSTHPAALASWWATHPHSLILPTGLIHDVLDVTVAHGLAVWQQLHRSGLNLPAARTPAGRLLLFVAADPHPLSANPEATDAGLIHHGAGSYVVAPPSTVQHGRLGWIRAPWVDHWQLPPPEPVLAALAATTPHLHVPSGSRRRDQRPVPQLSPATAPLLGLRRTP